MAAQNERALVASIVRAVRERFPLAWVTKVHGGPYQTAGIPDLLVSVEGRLVAIEVKHRKPGESREHALGRVTPIQAAMIGKIKDSGAVAGVALSIREALELIEQSNTTVT